MRFFYLFALCFLTGCVSDSIPDALESKAAQSTYSSSNKKGNSRYTMEQDGAPAGPLPVSFKEVSPKHEPLSRYGNPDSYVVEGRVYEVMKSSSGYKTRGIASWYGTKFHKQRTSSGDNYDMYAMTAAHKTLPLPTYVKVRNLGNGRVAIVKVNDRGPFRNDRVIDLSYAAAVKLGLLPQGTAPVEIEALDTGKHTAHYYVQAGAFASQELANALQGRLEKLTPSPVIVEQYNQQYVVRVGPFADKQMSDYLKNKLAANGIQGAFSLLR
ncbi:MULTISPECIES: septal ring lytic transglycosylase RlpA family protein [unclassified Legionella]|uniref:septal ring lytic transglycosylase RlpA family protein n=1 Tax=unclassified Legionella TaxID=2622702 RepID=UPI001055975D|nr:MULTISPECIES: septal ring lytic transglycosylase RlpA family protein [unclassified Legionella]MDI9818218.1 septal ring lytic transglycosylase RlpA family protein [Legionella sp. PL877]